MPRLTTGDVVRPRELRTVHGDPIRFPDRTRLTHLAFRGRAGCPAGRQHVYRVADRYVDLLAAGVREIAVFRSGAPRLRRRYPGLPFAVVADQRRRLCAEFGVPAAPVRTLLHRARPADVLVCPDGRVAAVRYGRSVGDHWTVEDLLLIAGQARRPPHPRS